MKISLNWLSEFVDLTLDAESLSHLLTMAGVEVEDIHYLGGTFPQVIVAQIISSEPHPNADRLSVCSVDDGSGTPRQIVCGAKNYRVGDKVPLALPGAKLPGDFHIKKGKLRGVESDGMLCSAKELNLAEDSDGLLILPAEAPIGSPVHELYPPDIVFEVEITPNRGDLLSHYGIARELSALTGKALVVQENGHVQNAPPAVLVDDQSKGTCIAYHARRIRGVRVGPSPAWLVRRLEAIGVRAINNVVDCTNLVLFETGQPLHAFDAARVHERIVIRHARDKENFHALDGQVYTLDTSDLVIADAHATIALAGVMGGEHSGVNAQTTDIILESAIFDPASVRRTARRHTLFSDSSARFERGVDPHGVLPALQRVTDFILELAGGELEGGVTSLGEPFGPLVRVELRPARVQQLLGVDISNEEISSILMNFGLLRIRETESASEWQIPSHRPDLTREVDLIEEIARAYGLDRIPAGRTFVASPESPVDLAYNYRMRLRRLLQGAGYQEARTLTLIPESALTDCISESIQPLRVRNPLGEESALLRPGLSPGLARAASFNARQGADSIRLFEIGRVFQENPPQERMQLGILLTGPVAPISWHDSNPEAADFFDLKGLIENIVPHRMQFIPCALPGLGMGAEIFVGEDRVGIAGQLRPRRTRELDMRRAVMVAELDLDKMQSLGDVNVSFKPWPRYPSVRRDIAMLVPESITHQQIQQLLLTSKEPLLARVEIFDVFMDATGEKVPKDFKSVAYALTYASSERTLTSVEVAEAHDRMKERLQTRLGAQLRE